MFCCSPAALGMGWKAPIVASISGHKRTRTTAVGLANMAIIAARTTTAFLTPPPSSLLLLFARYNQRQRCEERHAFHGLLRLRRTFVVRTREFFWHWAPAQAIRVPLRVFATTFASLRMIARRQPNSSNVEKSQRRTCLGSLNAEHPPCREVVTLLHQCRSAFRELRPIAAGDTADTTTC